MEKTATQTADKLVTEIANSLYECNGTSAGAKEVALIAARHAKEKAAQLDMEGTNYLYWSQVEEEINLMLNATQ